MAGKGGRPPLAADDASLHVGVSLPSRQYDDYCRRALEDDVSVPEIIRRDLRERKAEKEKQ
jgi:hypothetical protein